jgi:hypothetical protein
MRCRGPARAFQGYLADCPDELAAGAIGSHTLSALPPVQDTGRKPGCPASQPDPELLFGPKVAPEIRRALLLTRSCLRVTEPSQASQSFRPGFPEFPPGLPELPPSGTRFRW